MRKGIVYSTDPDDGPPSPFEALKPLASSPSEQPSAQPSKRPAAAKSAHGQGGNTPVRVSRERKGRGGKTVSVIAGVTREADRQALLKLLKTRLGTGGALEEDRIVVQGDHRERIVEILAELGYKAKVAGG